MLIFNDLHPIPISKMAPGRNWRTAWWSLTPPDPSPGEGGPSGPSDSEAPRFKAGHRSCSVMKPFLSTSNSAKSAATWPGTKKLWISVETHRNFKAFHGISNVRATHFPSAACYANGSCTVHELTFRHASDLASLELFFVDQVIFCAPKWDGLPGLPFGIFTVGGKWSIDAMMPWHQEFWFSSSQTLKLLEGMVVSYGQIWFSTKSLPRASQLSRLKWELTNCGPQCSAQKSLCIVNILTNCHTSGMALKNTERTTSGEYPPQQTVCPLTLVCQFLTCSTNGHMTPVEFA